MLGFQLRRLPRGVLKEVLRGFNLCLYGCSEGCFKGCSESAQRYWCLECCLRYFKGCLDGRLEDVWMAAWRDTWMAAWRDSWMNAWRDSWMAAWKDD